MPARSAPLPDPILFAAGDPGGANAVKPVLLELARRGQNVAVLDHGVLARDLPGHIALLPSSAAFSALCFGTSLTDIVPLTLARQARAQGLPVVTVLDNWVNYRARLEMDGQPLLVPDIYAVMDDKARDEAIADGVPAGCLRVTGHPNLASLADQWRDFQPQSLRSSLALPPGRELVVFINEPVAADQGTGPDHPGWRGYTEHNALGTLAAGLAGRNVYVVIIPHPRDDAAQVAHVWEQVQGDVPGRVLAGVPGRPWVMGADRVAGMASILLYESWLLGRPTISLQPGLVRQDLLSIATRPGVHLLRDPGSDAVGRWLVQAPGSVQADLTRHGNAPAIMADLMLAMRPSSAPHKR